MIFTMANEKDDSHLTESKTGNTVLPYCFGIILIGVLIQIVGTIKGDPIVFPSVFEILRTFFRLICQAHTYHLILTTVVHLFVSLVISSGIALFIGIAEGLSDFIHNLLKPLMTMLRSIPVIVLVVISMVVLNYSLVPYIASSLILIPVMSEAVCEGCRRIDSELIDVYRLNSTFNLKILCTVYLPLMAGFLKQAYANAVGIGIKIIITTEYLVQTKNSLGKAVFSSSYFTAYDEIYAYALIMILLVLLLTEVPIKILKFFKLF